MWTTGASIWPRWRTSTSTRLDRYLSGKAECSAAGIAGRLLQRGRRETLLQRGLETLLELLQVAQGTANAANPWLRQVQLLGHAVHHQCQGLGRPRDHGLGVAVAGLGQLIHHRGEAGKARGAEARCHHSRFHRLG